MHLSLLSDATISDLLDDASARAAKSGRRTAFARQHLEGVVRGLIFAAALLTPFALAFAPAAFGHPDAAGLDAGQATTMSGSAPEAVSATGR